MQTSFLERLKQRRGQGDVELKKSDKGRAELSLSIASMPVKPVRLSTVSVSSVTALAMAELLQTLATRYHLASINVSASPTKKELRAILEARTLEVLNVVMNDA